jgi:small subunit ribosomal protein S17
VAEERQDIEEAGPAETEEPEPQAAEQAPDAEPPTEPEPAEEAPAPQAAEDAVPEDVAPEPDEAAAEPAEVAEARAADQEPPEGEPEEVGEAEAAAEQPADAAAPAEAAAPARPRRKRLPRSQRRQRTKPKREKPAERRPIVRLAKPERELGRRQERRGVVVSSAMDKTIVVQVETVKAHPRYKKVVRRSRKFHAHDAENSAKVGDVVRIVESRPLSKTKTWRLAEIVEEAR